MWVCPWVTLFLPLELKKAMEFVSCFLKFHLIFYIFRHASVWRVEEARDFLYGGDEAGLLNNRLVRTCTACRQYITQTVSKFCPESWFTVTANYALIFLLLFVRWMRVSLETWMSLKVFYFLVKMYLEWNSVFGVLSYRIRFGFWMIRHC